MFTSVRSAVFFTLLAIIFTLPTFVSAQADTAGVKLRPAAIEDLANPGDTMEYEVTIENTSSEEKEYFIFTRDIVDVEAGGTPVYAEEGNEQTGYELSSWIDIDVESVTVAPDEVTSLPVTINVPENATPGSHFGGIFVSVEPPRMRSIGAGVGYQVANIVTITIAGDAVEKASIRSFVSDQYVYGSPNAAFTAQVENDGTVLIRPYGFIEIYNMLGEKVDTLSFNENQAGVFPGTQRELVAEWIDESVRIGRYTAVLSLVYGSDNRQSTLTNSVNFWILPKDVVLPAAGILAFLLLTTYLAIRFYIRNSIERAVGGRRVVRKQKRGRGMSVTALLVVVLLVVTALFLIILLALFA